MRETVVRDILQLELLRSIGLQDDLSSRNGESVSTMRATSRNVGMSFR